MRFKKTLQAYRHKCDGVAAVEFALIAPVLILLLVGTVDIGLFVLDRMELHNTAYATAEYVANVADDTNAQVIAEEAYGRAIDDLVVTSAFSCECADGVALACPVDCGNDDYQRRFIDIDVSGTFSPIFPYPGIPDSIDLRSTARMRVD